MRGNKWPQAQLRLAALRLGAKVNISIKEDVITLLVFPCTEAESNELKAQHKAQAEKWAAARKAKAAAAMQLPGHTPSRAV